VLHDVFLRVEGCIISGNGQNSVWTSEWRWRRWWWWWWWQL